MVMRRMKEDDIEIVKALIKVCTTYSDIVMDTMLSSVLMWERTCVSFGLDFIFCIIVFLGGLRGHRKPHHSPHPHSSTLPFHPGCFLLNPALPCPFFYPGSCYSCVPTNCLSQDHHATVHRGSGQQPPLLGLHRQQLPGDTG